MLETVSITAWRDTAAAPAGLTHNWLGIANDVNASIMPNNIWINNTVQFRLDFNVTMQAVMNSSNSFQGNSEDLSIGGTTTAYFSYKGTEFDAQ